MIFSKSFAADLLNMEIWLNKHTATMVLSCLYSHDTARIMKQAIELSREQRHIHLNISSPRVKVRETEVVMAM